MKKMKAILISLVAALILSFGAVALASPASANDAAMSRFVNKSTVAVGVTFVSPYNEVTSWAVQPQEWGGETYGNVYWEPRSFTLGPGWCLTGYFDIWGYGSQGNRTTCAGSSPESFSIFIGFSTRANYDFVATRVWYSGP